MDIAWQLGNAFSFAKYLFYRNETGRTKFRTIKVTGYCAAVIRMKN